MDLWLDIDQFEMPWTHSTAHSIQEMLRRQDPFVLADPNIDRYDVLLFRRFQEHSGAPLVAIMDQNVLNDVVEIIRATREERPPLRKGFRTAAAVMTFLQAANALIEPGIAVHEKADNVQRLLDLQHFRCADKVDARIYADLALGKISKLCVDDLPPLPAIESHLDFSKKILGRSAFRICILKIACLELEQRTPKERMIEFLRWSFEEYIFIAIPTLLACSYLSPMRAKGILKKVKSPDRNRALLEIENALWDAQLIDIWAKRSCANDHNSRSIILVSNDEALKRLAKSVCRSFQSEEDRANHLNEYFVSSWGTKDGSMLAGIYLNYASQISSPHRAAAGGVSPQYVEELTNKLESQLLRGAA